MNELDLTTEIRKEIRKLVPVLGKEKASKLEMAYLMQDEEGRKRVMEIVDTIKAAVFSDERLNNTALMEPPSSVVAGKGDFLFANVLYGKRELYPVYLNRGDLMTHIGVFGSSGSGKTNVMHWLALELNRLDIPILVFDFSKRNYRDLLTMPELREKIKIYTVGRNVSPFRFNPLKPPQDVEISQWAKEFSEVFDHAYSLLGGGRHIILKALKDLYIKNEIKTPRLQDLNTWIYGVNGAGMSARERNWLATASRPIESLCFMDSGDIFDCEQGILPSSFFEKGTITVLELDALSTNDKTFFIEIILQWIRDWLLVTNSREKLQGVVILEEAHNVLNREKGKMIGMETVMDVVFREIRELGVGMIYLDQHPSLVSYPALGNTSTHVYMNLGLDTQHSSDIQDASRMLGLDEEQQSYMRRLPVGHAFVLLRKSIFPNPFMIKFPLVQLEKGKITDDDVKVAMSQRVMVEIETKQEERRLNIAKVIRKIDADGWSIIDVLGKGGACLTAMIARNVRMSGTVLNENMKKLEQMGLVGEREVKLQRQNAKVYFLTEEGELLFKSKFDYEFQNNVPAETRDFLLNVFTLEGWWVEQRLDDTVRMRKEGREIVLSLAKTRDDVLKCLESNGGREFFFVCAGEAEKNKIMQLFAAYTMRHKEFNFVASISTVEEARSGKWNKIEFMSFINSLH